VTNQQITYQGEVFACELAARWAILLSTLGLVWRVVPVWEGVSSLLVYHAATIDADGLRPSFDQHIIWPGPLTGPVWNATVLHSHTVQHDCHLVASTWDDHALYWISPFTGDGYLPASLRGLPRVLPPYVWDELHWVECPACETVMPWFRLPTMEPQANICPRCRDAVFQVNTPRLRDAYAIARETPL
jgi:hypothetical protein